MNRSRWVLAAGGIAGLLAVYLVVTPSVRDHVLQATRAWRERSEGEALAHHLVSSESLLDYGAAHPDQVALACWEIGDERHGLYFNAARSQPASYASALLVLAAYASEPDPERRADAAVPLAHWEKYWLPGTDGGAHLAALLEARASGALIEDAGTFSIAGHAAAEQATVRLHDVVRAMIRHADPSAMDLLIEQVGRPRLTESVLRLGFPAEAVPLPASAVQLSLMSGAAAPELLARFRALPEGEYAAEVWRSFLQLRDDDALRARSLERLEQRGVGFSLRDTAELAAALAARGTAELYAHLMERIARDQLSGASYMRAQLDQPLRAAGVHEALEQLGSLRASEPGVYASVSYGRVRGGGATRVLAIMLRKLPIAVWLHLSSGTLLRRFEAELLADPELFAKAKAKLNQPRHELQDVEAAAGLRPGHTL